MKKIVIAICAILLLVLSGTLTACGYTEGLVFELVDGEYAVVGYEGSDTYVKIPSKYEGKRVTS